MSLRLLVAFLGLGLLLPGPRGVPVGGAGPLGGQEPLALTVDPGTGALTLRLGSVLDDGGLRRALHGGLPIRLRVAVELWKDGFFDSQRGEAEWRGAVFYDPLDRTYRVETSADTVLRTVASLETAGWLLSREFPVPLRPGEEGRFYYLARLEVETLSLSDLGELRRWLQGDLAPAVSGEGDVETAVERGLRRLMVRVLDLPARRYRVRTPAFDFEPSRDPGPEG